MKKHIVHIFFIGLLFGITNNLSAQHDYAIEASLNVETKIISISQEIDYKNTSKDTLNAIYLNDWPNAYSSPDTPLTQYMGEEFDRSLHLAKKRDKGYSKIIGLTDNAFRFLDWERPEKQPDIIRVQLKSPIYPGETYKLRLTYETKVPHDRFTRYGVDNNDQYKLQFWYISAATYQNKKWATYSNKNLDDLFLLPSNYTISFKVPKPYQLITDLDVDKREEKEKVTNYILQGKNRIHIPLFINKDFSFNVFDTEDTAIITDLKDRGVTPERKNELMKRVVGFMNDRLGEYPFKKVLISEVYYRKNPVYGLNQLPTFISPFPNDFLYEIKLVKAALGKYIDNTIAVDPRKEKWVTDALQYYLLMQYLNENYPDEKVLGRLSKIWGVRSYKLAQMKFNEAYPLLYMFMARKNLDQPLTTSKDSLIKFNYQIGNKYKSGLGLIYLDDYLNNDQVDTFIKEFFKNHQSKPTTGEEFENELTAIATKDIQWYFDEYVATRKKIDYKIKKIKKRGDSLDVVIKNKTGSKAPISLFSLKKDSVINKYWFKDITDKQVVTIPKEDATKLVLNYDKTVPEINKRDNWKTLGGLFSNNKKLSFKFFKDAEDPDKNQIFYVPEIAFNVYDGLSPGLRFYNKPFLTKPFVYDIVPTYSTKEKALIGRAKLQYNQYLQEGNLFKIDYRFNVRRFHYAPSLFFTSITPSVSFNFRTDDFRDNKRQAIFFRFVNILRDRDASELALEADPDYSVFNARFIESSPGAINFKSWFADFQVANQFAKVSFNYEYRRLFTNNRQVTLRLFAGKFLYNDSQASSGNFFSFALDRPTDYLFDFDYLGRSESTGLVSQQFIAAEGGFKSKLQPSFSNDWIATVNAGINIWSWIEVYGDVGLVKNKNVPTQFVYDSGIRLNLVPDYFELYFPVYSKLGWEIAQPSYAERIRFVITLSPRSFTGLFTRKWF
ncbi:metalloprotease [Spongiivirga sp. MCCC 1A20706]|uniref:metalloprotease n=1 Tax=Spongiivirga sp. MCCC 1A20706 TaxID=3160963 RepID=UPI003977C783